MCGGAPTIPDMRQGGGDGDHRDGDGVGSGQEEREDSGRQEKCVAINDYPGGHGSENKVQGWKDSCIGESNNGKDCHGETGKQGVDSSGEKVNWGEGGGEKMIGRENVRLKLALVECRLLLHDQVLSFFYGMEGRSGKEHDQFDC